MPGCLRAIWIKRACKGPMDPVDRVAVVGGRGLQGNADQGGARQVTLIERAAWEKAVATTGDVDLDPRVRRANLMLEDLELADSRGRVLAVGPVRILIRGATRPCRLMEESRAGLQAALAVDWRGGAYGEVLDDGEIALGDAAAWVQEAD